MTEFVATSVFSKRQPRFLPGDAYADLQKELIADPMKGRVMPGCGGLRKLRISDPRRQKGKRGGARVVYLHIPEVDQFFMLGIYGKDEKEDLTDSEKKEFGHLLKSTRSV